jgi:hypothetical protein
VCVSSWICVVLSCLDHKVVTLADIPILATTNLHRNSSDSKTPFAGRASATGVGKRGWRVETPALSQRPLLSQNSITAGDRAR